MSREKQSQYDRMTGQPIEKLILELGLPTTISMLVTNLYNMADTYFVGTLGTSASGATGVVFGLMAILQALGFMFGNGAGSIVSRRLGAKDVEDARRYSATSFYAALLSGILVLVLGLCFLTPLVRLLGSTDTILPFARGYAFYILLAAPAMVSSCVMNNILRYEGKASFAMIGLVTGGLLNIALDPLFIFGLGMGTAGAGLATALSQTISFCILLSMFLRGKTVSQFRITAVTHSPAEFGTILMTGMPSFGRQGLNSIGGMLLNIAARGYGDAAVAGMSIVSRIFMFIISVAIGTGQGFQPVAGFNYGAQKYRRVQQACLFTMAASFCFLSVILTACWFNAETLIRLFRDDPEVTAVALPAFRFQCFAMLLQPVIVAGNMLFQSIGKSGRATFLACCRQGVFFIPLILTLPRAFGLLGVEICQPIADVLTFFVTVPFLFPFLRQLVRMDEAEAAEV